MPKCLPIHGIRLHQQYRVINTFVTRPGLHQFLIHIIIIIILEWLLLLYNTFGSVVFPLERFIFGGLMCPAHTWVNLILCGFELEMLLLLSLFFFLSEATVVLITISHCYPRNFLKICT